MAMVSTLRDTFTRELGDKGNATSVQMHYDRHDNVESQILTVSGTWADGTGFLIKSDRIRAGADLTTAATELAQRLLKDKAPP